MLICERIAQKKLNKIRVPQSFVDSPPRPEKLILKTAKFVKEGELEKIYIDKDFNLVDGYCSYLIAKTLNSKKVKIIQVKLKEKKS